MDRNIWNNPFLAVQLEQAETPLWFWNDKLEQDELLRQLKLKSETGITCTIPHARTNQGDGYIGGYLDEDWFEKFQTVLEYKKENQESVWLYDEIDWPAGTCNKTITLDERNREQYIVFHEIRIPAGTTFRAQVKDLLGKPLYEVQQEDDMSEYAFNVFIVDEEDQSAYYVPNYFKYLIFGPELEFCAKRDAVAYIAKIHVDAYELGGDMQVNYLDKTATKQFITSTYDKYFERFPEYFGSTIKNTFNDETRMCNPIAWSRDFAEEFRQRKGYNLMPHLVDLILPGERSGRTRCDYFDVMASLFQENYFGELHLWCQEHNIGLFAHLLGEETLYGHARYSGDYLRQNKYLDIPGADHLGKGIGSLNIKFTSSGAHSYGKDMTAVEVFAGCGWDMTFDEYIRIVTWMFQNGMKIIINHGFFYSDRGNRKNDWPPSQFFQWQGWSRMKEGNAMIRRLHYAMTGGRTEADVLVYNPIESFWLHYLPDMDYTHGFEEGPYTKDKNAAQIDQETQLLMNGLISENLDFEVLHKDAVDNFEVLNGKIRNKLNEQSFSVLILPFCKVLPIETAYLCEQFAEQGGTILLLNDEPKYAMAKADDEKLQEIFSRLINQGMAKVFSVNEKNKLYQEVKSIIPMPVKIIKGVSKTINNHAAYDNYLIDPYLHTGEDITGVLYTRYIKNGKRNTLFMNYSNEPTTIHVEIEIQEMQETPEIWNTFTGEITKANVVKQREGFCEIVMDLPCDYGVFLVQ